VDALTLDDWLIQKNGYQGLVTYSLSPEEQAAYLSLIQTIWPYNFYWLNSSEVNDDMAEVTHIVIWEIFNCAKNLGALDPIIGATLTALKDSGNWNDPGEIEFFLEGNQAAIILALNAIGFHWRLRGCAAANWRSAMEMAYNGEY